MAARARVLLTVVALGVAGSAWGMAHRLETATSFEEVSTSEVEGPPTADSLSVPVAGKLTPTAADAFRHDTDLATRAIVVSLRAADCMTCEDLGRQLRELRQALPLDVPLIVWAEPSGMPVVRRFLRKERIRVDGLRPLAPDSVLVGSPLHTPAALLVKAGTTEAAGFSHPFRVPNVRPRSFAEELSPHLNR